MAVRYWRTVQENPQIEDCMQKELGGWVYSKSI